MDKSNIGFSNSDQELPDYSPTNKGQSSKKAVQSGRTFRHKSSSEEKKFETQLSDASVNSTIQNKSPSKIQTTRKVSYTTTSIEERKSLKRKRYVEEFDVCFKKTASLHSVKRAKAAIPITDQLGSFFQTAKSVGSSIYGQLALKKARHMITENVAEGSGQIVADKLGSYFSGKIMAAASQVSPIAAAATIGWGAGIAAQMSSSEQSSYTDILKAGLISAGVAGAAMWAAPAIATTVATAMSIESSLIATAAIETATKVLTGYVASSMHGTDEMLWSPSDPLDSYFVKGLQAVGVGHVFNQFTPAPVGLAGQVVAFGMGLASEGLAFNVKTIAEVAKKTFEGKLLTEVLPGMDEMTKGMAACLGNSLAAMPNDLQENKSNDIWVNTIFNLMPFVLTSAIPQEGQCQQDFAKSILNFYGNFLPLPVLDEMIQEISGHTVVFTCEAFNNYFNILNNNPEIKNAQENFNMIFAQIANESDEEKIPELKGLLEESFADVKSKIDSCIEEIIQAVSLQSLNPIQQLALSRFIEQLQSNKSLSEQIASLSSAAAMHAGNEINKITGEYVGIKIFNPAHLDFITFFFNFHLENLAKIVMLSALTGQKAGIAQEDTIKKFHTNIASILCQTMQISIGKNAGSLLFDVLEKQIQGAF